MTDTAGMTQTTTDAAAGDDPAAERSAQLAPAAIVLVGLAIGLFRQGAFSTPAQFALGLLVAAALVVGVGNVPLTRDDLRWPPIPALTLLAAWALLDGAVHGHYTAGIRPALLLAGLGALLLTCRRLTGPAREVLVGGLLAVGVVLAAAAWLGVLLHHEPWALIGQHVWRGGSLLTYPNAAAAVLVPLALLAFAALVARRGEPAEPLLGAAATVLLLGAAATLSRAGLLAGLVGLGLLCWLLGPRRVLAVAAAPALGALAGLAGLLPALPDDAGTSPLVGVAALVAGVLLGSLLPWLPRRYAAGLAGALVVTAAAGIAVAGSAHRSLHALLDGRFSISSADRAGGTGAALRLLGGHVFAGVGPGLDRLSWNDPDGGGLHVLRYVHDEYLQVGVELGVIGLLLLGTVLVALFRAVRRPPSDPADRVVWAGAVAAAAAVAVHSAFDFVWHLPAIPLLAAALLGLAGRAAVLEKAPSGLPSGRAGANYEGGTQ
jgi:hypothetical protein